MRRPRRIRAAAVAASVALVATLTATGAAAKPAEYVSRPVAAPSGAAATTAAAEAEIRGYWTPERMRAATPARARAKAKAGDGEPRPASGKAPIPWRNEPVAPKPEEILKAARAAGHPISVQAAYTPTVGKAFFIDPIDGREHYCSGAVVYSPKGRLVVTAGHCVANPLWMQGWIFAPGYDNGAPFGIWIALGLAARSDWIQQGKSGADLGVAIMDVNTAGQRVTAVGGNGISLNPPLGSPVDIFGYPGAINVQAACRGTTFGGLFAEQIGVAPCGFDEGGSGSPMLYAFNRDADRVGYLDSVAATLYPGYSDQVFGPQFNDINVGLILYAEQISPA